MEDERKWPEDVRFFLDQGKPEIDDQAEPYAAHRWEPGDPLTDKLVRCLEALRDVRTNLRTLASPSVPTSDKRSIKQIIVPVYTLAMALRDLYNDVQSNAWSLLTVEEQRALAEGFREFRQRVPTDKGSPLYEARNTIGAHLDRKAHARRQVWDSLDLRAVLGWIRFCLRILEPLLAADVYTWKRNGGSNVMRFDGKEVHLRDDPTVGLMFGAITLTETPRRGIAREAEDTAAAWVEVWQKHGLELREDDSL